jgi:hypothetical protein
MPQRTVGGVDYTNASDSRAYDVGHSLDTYFSGINTSNYESTRTVIDPRSAVDPNNADHWNSFVHDVSTTHDSDIVLTNVSDDPTGQGAVTAQATFRSTQSPGYGPKGSEQETCTLWNINFTLSEPTPSEYRILKTNGEHSSC